MFLFENRISLTLYSSVSDSLSWFHAIIMAASALIVTFHLEWVIKMLSLIHIGFCLKFFHAIHLLNICNNRYINIYSSINWLFICIKNKVTILLLFYKTFEFSNISINLKSIMESIPIFLNK